MQKGSRKFRTVKDKLESELAEYEYEIKDGSKNRHTNPLKNTTEELVIIHYLEQLNRGDEDAWMKAEFFFTGLVHDMNLAIHQERWLWGHERFYSAFTQGMPFVGGGRYRQPKTIQLVDWDRTYRNLVELVSRVPGCQDDGFVWDYLVRINGFPIAVIVMEPARPGDRPAQHAIETAQAQLAADPHLHTTVQLIICSDGSHVRVGTVQCPEALFRPWHSDQGTYVNQHSDASWPIISVLQPDTLFPLLHDYIYCGDSEDEDELAMENCHVFYATEAIMNHVFDPGSNIHHPAYVALSRMNEDAEMEVEAIGYLLQEYIPRNSVWNEDRDVLTILNEPPTPEQEEEWDADPRALVAVVASPKLDRKTVIALAADHPHARVIHLYYEDIDPLPDEGHWHLLYDGNSILK